jgi:pimeloyl-ACP methyl ester carboxylesterase
MPKLFINGINLYYESKGYGFPVVFTHGFAESHAMWKPQEPLSEEFRLITYDVRGHATTDSPTSPDQYSADIAVNDLFQLLKALGINKAVLGGHSMGGYISMRFYLKHPEMVAALIIQDTGPGYRNPARMAEWNKTPDERARRLETEGIGFMLKEPATDARRREVLLNHNPVGLANMSRKVVAQFDSTVIENLENIKVPSIVIVGEKDTPFLQAAQYMAKTIPGAKYVVIPGAGHNANIDDPTTYNRAVREFLRGLNLKSG